MVAPWLDNTPTPVVSEMTHEQLLVTWGGSRNSLVAVMAADEIMCRIANGQLRVIETIEVTDEVRK